jgi:SAM-dependent methyltransferase
MVVGDKKGLNILDVGVGTGDELEILQEYGTIDVIDICPDALEIIPEDFVGIKRCLDICETNLPSESYDIVVAFDVLEHIKKDNEAMDEIKRLLKSDGFFIYTVPAFDFLFSNHDRALGHIRRYSRSELNELSSGMLMIKTGYWMFSLFLPVALKRLISKSDKSEKSDLKKLPEVINEVLYRILTFENVMIRKGLIFPFGLTMFGIYKKK